MKIDIYDFDGTIYSGDSTIDFYLYCLKHNLSLLRFLPIQILYLIKYKLGLVGKVELKEKFFSFLKGTENVEEKVEKFWSKNIKKIRKDLMKDTLNKKYIISASPEFLLKGICKQIGDFELIASKVNSKNGEFQSENCYGEEKVNRLKEVEKDYEIDNFYSDSKSDKFLAELANNSFFVKRGGKIEKWKNK